MTRRAARLSVTETADELGVSIEHTRRLIRSGRLPAINVGTGSRPTYRISRVDLDAYLRARRAVA